MSWGKNAALFLDDLTPEAMVNGIIEAGYLNQGRFAPLRNVFICRRENWMRYWRC